MLVGVAHRKIGRPDLHLPQEVIATIFGLLRRRRTTEVHDPAQQAANETAHFIAGIRAALEPAVAVSMDDPFVLGLISAHAQALARAMAGTRVSQVMVESAQIAAAELTLGPPEPSRAEVIAALQRARGFAEFRHAQTAVDLIVGARYGHGPMVNDPRLRKARKRVAAMPESFRSAFGTDRDAQVAALLTEDFVLEPMRARQRFR